MESKAFEVSVEEPQRASLTKTGTCVMKAEVSIDQNRRSICLTNSSHFPFVPLLQCYNLTVKELRNRWGGEAGWSETPRTRTSLIWDESGMA